MVHPKQTGLIQRDQTVYYAGSAQFASHPSWHVCCSVCCHRTEMAKAGVRATHLSNISQGVASWVHFPWAQPLTESFKAFRVGLVQMLQMGVQPKESCPDRKSPEACRCLRPFSKNACGVLSGWSTTNVVTQERISFVPNLRMTGGPTEDGAAKTQTGH